MPDVLMECDGVRTEVHLGSVAIMRGLGWTEVEPEAPNPSVEGGGDNTVLIPPDWRDLHWKQRTALAARLTGEAYSNVDDANEAIAAEEALRVGKAEG